MQNKNHETCRTSYIQKLKIGHKTLDVLFVWISYKHKRKSKAKKEVENKALRIHLKNNFFFTNHRRKFNKNIPYFCHFCLKYTATTN
jgi:hypothetical protein